MGKGSYDGSERRAETALTEEEIDRLAAAVQRRLERDFYVTVGKTAFRAVVLLVGSGSGITLLAHYLASLFR